MKDILVVDNFNEIPFKHMFHFGSYKRLSICKYIIRRLNYLGIKACVWSWERDNKVHMKPFHIVTEYNGITKSLIMEKCK